MIKYIFISYVNRAGSTYLLNLLSKMMDIFVCPEANILYDCLLTDKCLFSKFSSSDKQELLVALKNDYQIISWGINEFNLIKSIKEGYSGFEIFLSILNLYKNQMYPEAKFVVYKHNNLYKLYPRITNQNILFVSLIRDVRSIFTSQKKTLSPYSNFNFNKNPIITAYSWKEIVSETSALMKFNNTHIIKFEDLIINQKACLMRFINKIGLKFSDKETLKYLWIENRLNNNDNILHQNIDKNPLKAKVDSWQEEIDTLDLKILEKITSRQMDIMEYKPSHYQVCPIQILLKLAYYKCRIYLGLDNY